MKSVILIPARYASSRFPGKPLAMLTLPDGHRKSLIEMSYETACSVSAIDAVYVTTDDPSIQRAAQDFGAEVIMTSDTCRNGTERCAEAMESVGLDADLVINLQGDAPLTPPWFVEDLIDAMQADPTVDMATPVLRLDKETYALFREDRLNNRIGGTTAVFDRNFHALYFSKEVLPFLDLAKLQDPNLIPVFHHVGVYAYRPSALRDYRAWQEGPLETLEGLEQLRFLENSHSIKCVEVEALGRLFWELNNPEDIAHIETALRHMA